MFWLGVPMSEPFSLLAMTSANWSRVESSDQMMIATAMDKLAIRYFAPLAFLRRLLPVLNVHHLQLF